MKLNGTSMTLTMIEVIEDVTDIWPGIRCDIESERYTEEGPG